MTKTRAVAAAAVLAGLAVGTAGTAWADQAMSGTYKAAWKSYSHTWTVTSCGDGCANVTWDTGGNSRATLSNGTWTIDDPASPGAVQCADGSSGVAAPHYSWDAVTLRGEMWNTVPAGTCGLSSSSDTNSDPFTLTKLS